ncbi:unnamed protein product [Caenorhabditis bovis]|uniref:Uncharacterized protein n=1 Tax=Caenorhabditis bovis TaxID=2654633 RepID=A0A8S1ECK3_9PELO|nr:unnamed protein product [Caenorhabditis bovis]
MCDVSLESHECCSQNQLLNISLEHVEDKGEFNFYIKSISNCVLDPTLIKRRARVIIYLVKNVSRKFFKYGNSPLQELGDIETKISYMPTIQRLVIHYCVVTNLKSSKTFQKIYIRSSVFIDTKVIDIRKTELKNYTSDACSDDGVYFTKKMVFEVKRLDIENAQLLIQVVGKSEDRKYVIGAVLLNYDDDDYFQQIFKFQRKAISQLHNLKPNAG